MIKVERIKESGTIWRDPRQNDLLYLRFYYRGKEFTRSLETPAISIGRRAASSVRKKAEAERDAELLRALVEPSNAADKAQANKDFSKIRLQDEIYRVSPDNMGFLQEFYPEETTNRNTRYDNEKLLNLFLRKLADIAKVEPAYLTVAHMTSDRIKASFQLIQKTHAKKTQQKVSFILKKFLRREMERNVIPTDLKLIDWITDETPSNVAVIKVRQKELPEEIWNDTEDLAPIIKACKEGHPLTLPLDYEIYWVMRYMGIPPSDVYQLTADDFEMGPQGLELHKERAKNDDDTFAVYAQPINKGLEEDKETERIIRARMKVCKNGQRLFEQPLKIARLRNDKQDDKTRWVSNFSGRRTALQKALGLKVKGVKGLRATFASFWISKHVPESTIESWCGWAPGSTMKRKFYSTIKTASYWVLPKEGQKLA